MPREYELCNLDAATDKNGAETTVVSSSKWRGITTTHKKGDNFLVSLVETDQPLYRNDEIKYQLAVKVGSSLKKMLKADGIKRNHKILAVGLGNEGLTADALGAKCIDRLANRLQSVDNRSHLMLFKTSVGAITGIDTANIVSGLVNGAKPDGVILIDTLATKNFNRLASIVQMSDKGITPGSGVGNDTLPLNKEKLNIPVIAMGVPLVIYLKHILASLDAPADILKNLSEKQSNMVVASKEIDLEVDDFADVLASGIFKAIYGD